jgi:RecA/RadA recombinase
MAPFAERDGDLANAWMEGLGDVIVPREPLLPLSRSVNSKLTTLCPRLDAWLRGGVPTRSVTEIAGEAGSAKTQLALQLLIAAQLPRAMGGLDGAAVYVHTEGRAPLSRLKQLVASHPAVRAFVETKTKTKTKTEPEHDFLRGVYVVETLDDPDGLWTALASIASVLGGNKQRHVSVERPVRLIVVDSVSSPFRESDATIKNGAVRRAHALSRVAALLREYAHRHDIAVVVTNHVVDAVTNDDTTTSYVQRNEKRQKLFGPMRRRLLERPIRETRSRFVLGQLREHAFVSAPVRWQRGRVRGWRGCGWGRGHRRGHAVRLRGVFVVPAALKGRRRRRRADDIRRAERRRVRRGGRGGRRATTMMNVAT